MSVHLPEAFFEELEARLRGAGLPERQVCSFVTQYREYEAGRSPAYDVFENHQMPSEDCFRTLAEAQKIFDAEKEKSQYVRELPFIKPYLQIPYSTVTEAKKTMAACFGCDGENIEAAYYQDPQWLLIAPESVTAFAEYLKSRFSDPALVWEIYQKAALLGLEKAQQRIDETIRLLGTEIAEQVIRRDLQGSAYLFYRWFTDPIGCIAYMLECGLTPEKVGLLLESDPWALFAYKEGRKRKYHHDQEYIDRAIGKFLRED